MKKALAIVLALVLVIGMTVNAFAAGTTALSVKDSSGYTGTRSYEAYQILTASVDGENYAYGLNEKYKNVLIAALGLDADATEEEIITAIGDLSHADDVLHFATDLYNEILAAGLTPDYPTTGTWDGSQVNVDQGYWLIADVTDLSDTDYSNSLVMVDTVGDTSVQVNNKPDVPVTNKKVDDEDDSIVDPTSGNEDAVNWQDTADYDIGDEVPYSITGQMPNNVAEYKYYAFLIGDYVEEGLTFVTDSFKVTVNGAPKTIGVDGTADVDFWYTLDTVTGDDGKQVSQKLYVYPAHGYETHELNATTPDPTDYVTKDASSTNGGDFLKLFPAGAAHSTINSATFSFTYTCILNENAVIGKEGNPNEYELKFSNNPYGDSFGKTVIDTNLVFTYKAVFDKVDGNGNPLEGADFDIYKFVATKEELTDAQKEAAVNIVDIEDAEATKDAADAKTLVFHPGANNYGYLVKVEKKAVDASGTEFAFNGMDAGYYRLVETVVPTGFNGIDPVDFHVVADHDSAIIAGDDALNSLNVVTRVPGEMTMEGDVATGAVSAAIENHSGNELPSTGGVGTTLFYVIGGIMVLAAVVLLITKKRMAA